MNIREKIMYIMQRGWYRDYEWNLWVNEEQQKFFIHLKDVYDYERKREGNSS